MIHILIQFLLLAALLLPATAAKGGKAKVPQKTPLDVYLEEALGRGDARQNFGNAGSVFTSTALMADLNRDLRALQVDDVVTILVVERASSVTSGSVATDRNSKARTGFDTLFGQQLPTSLLPNLVGFEGSSSLEGEGSTSRQVSVSTTLSARVTHVLPNGNLALEGVKRIGINGEHQEVKVRGVIRQIDLGRQNTVPSDRLAMLEVTVNGKGVVADAIRKPHFLVKLLTRILPF
ncbi:MAG: flagellar basal body L-ring protein FlgH [Bryobacterales bacterium]|nr:flagellar basal body L-ring protein FlgH [Bryobacterales bacterium]